VAQSVTLVTFWKSVSSLCRLTGSKKKPRSDRIRISLNFTPKRPPHILIREAGYFGKCEEFIKLFNRSCLTCRQEDLSEGGRLADLVEKMVLEGYLRQ
jgi:hypothetical protein